MGAGNGLNRGLTNANGGRYNCEIERGFPMTHKKGNVAEGKVNRNWRILVGPDKLAHEEAQSKGFNSVAAWINNLLVRYFNGETIRRDP